MSKQGRGILIISGFFFIIGIAAFFLPDKDDGLFLTRVLPNWGLALVLVVLAIIIFLLNLNSIRKKD